MTVLVKEYEGPEEETYGIGYGRRFTPTDAADCYPEGQKGRILRQSRVKRSQDINDESSDKSRRIIKGSMEGTGTDYKESKEGPDDKVSRPTKIQSTFQ
jgi:hypothetical protein